MAELQWCGLLGRSCHVDVLTERIYLGAPSGVAFTGLAALLLLGDVAVVRRVGMPLFVALMILSLVSLVLMVTRPRFIRPAWQRALVEANRRSPSSG